MKVMSREEAAPWCRKVGPRMTAEGVLQYTRAKQHRFFVEAPEEFRRIMSFTRAMLTFRGEAAFAGGLLWLRRWDIGSPQFIWLGWKIIEDIRRVHGDLRSLETAPAQVFRDDEFLYLQAFLVQVVGFGWVAECVSPSGNFFMHFKDNRQVCFTARSPQILKELRVAFEDWNPTDEDPMVKRLAESERRHDARQSDHRSGAA
jgi:hypothetical protein